MKKKIVVKTLEDDRKICTIKINKDDYADLEKAAYYNNITVEEFVCSAVKLYISNWEQK